MFLDLENTIFKSFLVLVVLKMNAQSNPKYAYFTIDQFKRID